LNIPELVKSPPNVSIPLLFNVPLLFKKFPLPPLISVEPTIDMVAPLLVKVCDHDFSIKITVKEIIQRKVMILFLPTLVFSC
jgi:hypothetical protein